MLVLLLVAVSQNATDFCVIFVGVVGVGVGVVGVGGDGVGVVAGCR